MRPVNIGLIGAGKMGVVHAHNLSFRIPGARLQVVADINASRAADCAAACQGVEAAYEDYRRMLTHPGLNAVVICTPPDTHAQMMEAAARGAKHIFCEKPLDCDLSRADAALAAVRDAGVILQVGLNRRFDERFLQAQKQVAAGAIGDPLTLHIVSRDPPRDGGSRPPGDLFLDTTVHDLDMARFVMGSEIAALHALAGTMAGPDITFRDDPDTAVVLLQFESGAAGTIDNSRLSVHGYDQRLEVFGSRGSISVDNEHEHAAEALSGEAPPQPFFVRRYGDSYLAEMRAFIDCVLHDKQPLVSGPEARTALVLALAALRSYREGVPVRLAEPAGA